MSNGSVSPNIDPDLPTRGPGSRKRRRIFLASFALVVVLALVFARDVLLPFLFALVLAYVLSPVVDTLERTRIGRFQPPRWLAIIVLYIGVLGCVASLVAFSAPRLAAELSRLAHEAPRITARLRREWIPSIERRVSEAAAQYLGPLEAETTTAEDEVEPRRAGADPTAIQVRPNASGGYDITLPSQGIRVAPDGDDGYRVTPARSRPAPRDDLSSAFNDLLASSLHNSQHSAVTLFRAAREITLSLSRGIFGLAMTLMMSSYILLTRDRILGFFRTLYPPGLRHEFDDLVRRLDHGLAGVVRGQLMICLVNGVLSGIGFALLGLKYWTFLTLIATIMSIVPIFGSILSTVPALIVALPQGVGLACLVLAWIVAVHQLEANVFNPKILGDAARVHPVLVIFALLAGEHSAGVVGALLAVPTLSIVQTFFFLLREMFLGVPRPTTLPPPAQVRNVAMSPSGQAKPVQGS